MSRKTDSVSDKKTPEKQMWKRICFFSILAIILIPAILFLYAFLKWKNIQNDAKLIDPDQIPVNDLKAGDLICRHGIGFWSEKFRLTGAHDQRFSHIGIILRKDDGLYVIHAEADDFSGNGVVFSEPLKKFLKTAQHTAAFRLKGVDGENLAKAAETFCGTPFDWQFDLKTKDELYCTELIQEALAVCAPEIKLKSRDWMGMTILPIEACTVDLPANVIFELKAED